LQDHCAPTVLHLSLGHMPPQVKRTIHSCNRMRKQDDSMQQTNSFAKIFVKNCSFYEASQL